LQSDSVGQFGGASRVDVDEELSPIFSRIGLNPKFASHAFEKGCRGSSKEPPALLFFFAPEERGQAA
jgi:hypothetical protein